jgi:diketogulonate reductase-like aldo/keto reductase
MPTVNLGGVWARPSNYSAWLELGGRGIDSAWDYGGDVQQSAGKAIDKSTLSRSEIFVTTKVRCCSGGGTPGTVLRNAAMQHLNCIHVAADFSWMMMTTWMQERAARMMMTTSANALQTLAYLMN